MMMKNIFLPFLIFYLHAKASLAWQQLGGTIPSTGSVLDSSEDGTRIAIGSPESGNGHVSIYDFDTTNKSWQLMVTIQGEEDEGMGDHISLSPDGLFVAIRRHHVTSSVVQVYQLDDESPRKIGSDLNTCTDGGEGFSVAMTQATIRAYHGAHYWLLVACESHDNDRGMIQLFQLKNDKSTGVSAWEPFLEPLVGDDIGDRFGTSVDLINAPSPSFAAGRVVRVAVSSPHHDEDRGLVQMFSADHEVGWSQIGSNLKGDIAGQQFGTSIAMSATERPYLLVGSPEWKHTSTAHPRGMVQLYHWRSLAFGQNPSWNAVGHPLEGSVDIGRFGERVAISSDGGFVAVSSMDSLLQLGYINMYERDTYSTLTSVGIHPWGGLMAMNGPGSVIVSSSGPSSETRVVLDDREFCKVPLNDSAAPSNVLEVYLERKTCRDGVTLVNDEHSCNQILVSSSGDPLHCIWVDTPVDEHASNPAPSVVPTSTPTFQSTDSPTSMDTTTTPSTTSPTTEPFPSVVPTHYRITETPSIQPSSQPSVEISSSPTDNPTMRPSTAPSLEASVFPSIIPTTSSPSLHDREDTTVPTLAPQPTIGELGSTISPSLVPTLVDESSPNPSEESSVQPTIEPTITPTVGTKVTMTDAPSLVETSTSPTSKAPNDLDYNDDGVSDVDDKNFVRACRCDDANECVNQALPVGSPLKVCVFLQQSELSSTSTLRVDHYELSQDSLSIGAINDGYPISSDVSQECVDGTCHIQTSSINALFYGDDRPSYLIASGTVVTVETRNGRNLRASIGNKKEGRDGNEYRFETIVTLKHTLAKSITAGPEEGVNGSGSVNDDGSKPSWLVWLLVALLLLVLVYIIGKKVRQRMVGSNGQ